MQTFTCLQLKLRVFKSDTQFLSRIYSLLKKTFLFDVKSFDVRSKFQMMAVNLNYGTILLPYKDLG